VQVIVEAFLAVAPVGGDGPGTAPGAVDDPLDSRGVGRVALFQGVVQDDAVVVVNDLGLVAELDGLAEAAPGARPGRPGRAG
jgi:hypothetical protein